MVSEIFYLDTYSIKNSQNRNVTINEIGIANFYEKTEFFKRHENYSDYQWIDVENEHFIVWMAMETYKNFRKLWGRIDMDLRPDNYTLFIMESKGAITYKNNFILLI